MSTATLQATIPTTREDQSALPAADIASITFQKVPAGAAAGAAPTVLQTNSEASGGLLPADLAFSDSSASVGDMYTCFVTDNAGNVGALSNVYTAAAPPPPVSPPSGPTLTGTFTP